MSDRVVWKYGLEAGYQDVLVPPGAEVLGVHEQRGSVCLWALVDPRQRPMEARRFLVVPTGVGLCVGSGDRFLGSVFLRGGDVVLHVFEVREGEKR